MQSGLLAAAQGTSAGSLGVAVCPDGEECKARKAQQLQGTGGGWHGSGYGRATLGWQLVRHTQAMPSWTGATQPRLACTPPNSVHSRCERFPPSRTTVHACTARTWMMSPTRVMPQPRRILSSSGVPEDWEEAQMAMPMAWILQPEKKVQQYRWAGAGSSGEHRSLIQRTHCSMSMPGTACSRQAARASRECQNICQAEAQGHDPSAQHTPPMGERWGEGQDEAHLCLLLGLGDRKTRRAAAQEQAA